MQVLWVWAFLSCYMYMVVGTVTLPNLQLTKACPAKYRIMESGSSAVQIEVKNVKNACERIQSVTDQGSYGTTSDLSPVMATSSIGNQNVLNITWPSAITKNKHPKWYLLQLTKHVKDGNSHRQSTSCILLRIRNRKVDKNKKLSKLFFDCIELVREPETYLSVQIWSLPSRQIAKMSCQFRQRRSLRVSQVCTGQMQCSEEYTFPLSLNVHMSSICHCSDRPKLSIERLQNCSLKIDIWNLPKFAYLIKLWIRRGYEELYAMNLTGTRSFNESRTVITDRAFGPGNYTPVVYAVCAGDQDDIKMSGRTCQQMDIVQLGHPFEVPYPPVTVKPEYKPEIITMVSILGAVVFTCVITVIIFCVLRWRQNNSTKEHKGIQSEIESLLTPFQRNNETENKFLQLARQNSEKMLIYHQENECHIDAVSELQNLSEAFGVKLVTNGDLNWRDFAEMAGRKFTEIVIVMSVGLFQICKSYKYKNEFSNQKIFEKLLKERHYEYVPCVVMDKLQILIQENPENCNFSVHFVSLQSDCNLTEEFINTFDFLKRGSNCFSYKLNLNDSENSDKDNSVQLDRKCLVTLLSRLKGVTEGEDIYSQIETAVSSRDFGTHFSCALYDTNQSISCNTT